MFATVITAATLLLIIRIFYVFQRKAVRNGPSTSTCRLAVFLGSGGHTSEIVQMLKGLNTSRYRPRIYIVSEGDDLSAAKVANLELAYGNNSPPTILTIPRARKVLQPLKTVPFTALVSLAVCIKEITLEPLLKNQSFADLLLLNGPGTCVPLMIAILLNRVLGISSPRIVYIESFTRVKDVSLTGRIVRPFVDSFVVQWPSLVKDGQRGQYAGWLI